MAGDFWRDFAEDTERVLQGWTAGRKGEGGGWPEARGGGTPAGRPGLKAIIPSARSRSESEGQGGPDLLEGTESGGKRPQPDPSASWAPPPGEAQASGPTWRESAADFHSSRTGPLRTCSGRSARPTRPGEAPLHAPTRRWPGHLVEPPCTTEQPQPRQLEPACDPPDFAIMPATREALWEIG